MYMPHGERSKQAARLLGASLSLPRSPAALGPRLKQGCRGWGQRDGQAQKGVCPAWAQNPASVYCGKWIIPGGTPGLGGLKTQSRFSELGVSLIRRFQSEGRLPCCCFPK